MSELSTSCHRYVEAEKRLRAIEMYVQDLKPGVTGQDFGLRVEWSFGSACPGYKELAAGVRARVEAVLPGLISQAVADAQHALDAALASLTAGVQQRDEGGGHG